MYEFLKKRKYKEESPEERILFLNKTEYNN